MEEIKIYGYSVVIAVVAGKWHVLKHLTMVMKHEECAIYGTRTNYPWVLSLVNPPLPSCRIPTATFGGEPAHDLWLFSREAARKVTQRMRKIFFQDRSFASVCWLRITNAVQHSVKIRGPAGTLSCFPRVFLPVRGVRRA